MERTDMEKAVQELRELRRMADELAHKIEGLQDGIKAQMDAEGLETVSGTDWKVTYKAVTTSRIDTAALKKALPTWRVNSRSRRPRAASVWHKKSGLCPGTPMQTDTDPTAKRADTGEHRKSLYGYYTGFLRSFQVKTWSGGKSPPAPPRALQA